MKIRLPENLRAALLGLACAWAVGLNPAAHAQITGTNQITFTDFDNTSVSWSYGYFYSWNVPGTPPEPGTWLVDKNYTDAFIDPTNGPICLSYTFTNAPYQGPVETNSAGYGTGFGFPLSWGYDPAIFSSTDLADYLFSFDARVAGLAPGQSSASCEIQPMIFAGGKILQKNIGYTAGTNWAHFTFTLADGGFADGTTYASFTNGQASVSELRVGHNNHMPHDAFGWDDYNAVLLDNLKLEVRQYAGPPPPPPPTVSFPILDWNMDDKPMWYTYGGYSWSQNSYLPIFTYDGAAAGYGVSGGNAWILQMDNSALAPPNTPQWAGGGTGGGGPVNFSQFDTADLGAYRFTCDVRMEGINLGNPDKTNTTCAMQLFLDAPDDTLQPPDANTDPDLMVRLDFPITAGTNVEHLSFLLKSGTPGAGAKANFTSHYNTIVGLRTQWQIENANSGADWEFDANNALVVDNLKLDRIYPACPPLTITRSGNDVVLSWGTLNAVGYAKVQRAANLTGPYLDVPGATNSPVTLPAASASGYFRTQWVSGQ